MGEELGERKILQRKVQEAVLITTNGTGQSLYRYLLVLTKS
ncbi:hypothetical protein [Flavobacterium sp.]|nr:hypothetical protein [Flavobacterium sp.]